MRLHYRSLREKHRRRYAAVEALKIGYGGVAYVARVLGTSRRTLYAGIRELEQMGDGDGDHAQRPSGAAKRVRRRGGGRRPMLDGEPELSATLHEVLEAHNAGSPTDEHVRWTDLKHGQLAQELLEHGVRICRSIAAAWLQQARFRRRALRQELITGAVDPEQRDAQFRRIAPLRRLARQRGVLVFSIDTKTKELLGKLHRPGQCYGSAVREVYDQTSATSPRHPGPPRRLRHRAQPWLPHTRHLARKQRLRLRRDRSGLGALFPTALSRRHRTAAALRLWWRQRRTLPTFQGRPHRARRPTWHASAHRPLFALYLEVESRRTPLVQPSGAALAGCHARLRGNGAENGCPNLHADRSSRQRSHP